MKTAFRSTPPKNDLQNQATALNLRQLNRIIQNFEAPNPSDDMENNVIELLAQHMPLLQQLFMENNYPAQSLLPTYRQQLEQLAPQTLSFLLRDVQVAPQQAPIVSYEKPSVQKPSVQKPPLSFADIVLNMDWETKRPEYKTLFSAPDFPEQETIKKYVQFIACYQNIIALHLFFNRIPLYEITTNHILQKTYEKSLIDPLKTQLGMLANKFYNDNGDWAEFGMASIKLLPPVWKNFFEFSYISHANVATDPFMSTLKKLYPNIKQSHQAAFLLSPQDYVDLFVMYNSLPNSAKKKVMEIINEKRPTISSDVKEFFDELIKTRSKNPFNAVAENLYQKWADHAYLYNNLEINIHKAMCQKSTKMHQTVTAQFKKQRKEVLRQPDTMLSYLWEKASSEPNLLLRNQYKSEYFKLAKQSPQRDMKKIDQLHNELYAEAFSKGKIEMDAYCLAEKNKTFAGLEQEQNTVISQCSKEAPGTFYLFYKFLCTIGEHMTALQHIAANTAFDQAKTAPQSPTVQNYLQLTLQQENKGEKSKVLPSSKINQKKTAKAQLLKEQERAYINQFKTIYENNKTEKIICNFETIHKDVLYTDDSDLKAKLENNGLNKFIYVCRKANANPKRNCFNYGGFPTYHGSKEKCGTIFTVMLPNNRQAVLAYCTPAAEKNVYNVLQWTPGAIYTPKPNQQQQLIYLRDFGALDPASDFTVLSQEQSAAVFRKTIAETNTLWKKTYHAAAPRVYEQTLMNAVAPSSTPGQPNRPEATPICKHQ